MATPILSVSQEMINMTDKMVAASNQLKAAVNKHWRYIAVDTDNASPEENEQILNLVEHLNTQRELDYYTAIYDAAQSFVETFTEWQASQIIGDDKIPWY